MSMVQGSASFKFCSIAIARALLSLTLTLTLINHLLAQGSEFHVKTTVHDYYWYRFPAGFQERTLGLCEHRRIIVFRLINPILQVLGLDAKGIPSGLIRQRKLWIVD
ncbi:hypothetical protein [Allorhodopirellula solitaria]|uniref:hypothetical protein n=1 Tax=Allorhodopirellula solitaria TaxID=2527987 RepID=UPI00164834F5|nr:hypothetical protein [Allorhodopirellula solitaria]